MSRLIDADLLIKIVKNVREHIKEVKGKPVPVDAVDMFSLFVEMIDDQKTAYDIGKIVEQLEELEKEHAYKVYGQSETYSQYNEAWQDYIDRVIGIVKRGME